MRVVNDRHEPQADPQLAFGEFLHAQAAEAGMGADKIARAFEAAALRQQEQLRTRREAGEAAELPAHPISEMAASKSHIDRLFKGRAHPKPPFPFTLQFLKITNSAAGLSAEEHQMRWKRARFLLQAMSDAPVPPRPVSALAPRSDTEERRGDAVAILRLEVDLERARHTETRLRYALRDHDVLLSTLLQIVSTLREIIASNDVRELQARRIPAKLAQVRDETRQALDHKATAQQEADRATARIRVLEDLWSRARAEAQRLASHPDAAGLALSHVDPQQAPPPILAGDLLTGPALNDIGVALAKAHEVNLREEEVVQELQSVITPQGDSLEPAEELTVLISATRLSDPGARRTALAALATGWSHDPVAREAVTRLADDLDEAVRIAAVGALAEGWSGDSDVRDAVLRHINDPDENVRWAAVRALAVGWPGDDDGRKAVANLTWGENEDTRRVAIEALAEGWGGEPAALECVSRRTRDTNAKVQEAAFVALAKGWAGSAAAADVVLGHVHSRDRRTSRLAIRALADGWGHNMKSLNVLRRLAKDPHTDTRQAAISALAKGWAGDRLVLSFVLRLATHPDWTTRRTVIYALASGWPKESEALRAVIGLTADMDENVRETASEVLGTVF
uniref:Putative signal transduction protein n=1 Tax=Streptomyces sp. FR1 TaxID=349971 RepID=V9Z3K8_9ACTN|nr:HEAT repeat domain-containing protein [Streptomyces sp. FR1]AHE38708.1 Putative signal transduction protein [Streptomyces sp. FR1]